MFNRDSEKKTMLNFLIKKKVTGRMCRPREPFSFNWFFFFCNLHSTIFFSFQILPMRGWSSGSWKFGSLGSILVGRGLNNRFLFPSFKITCFFYIPNDLSYKNTLFEYHFHIFKNSTNDLNDNNFKHLYKTDNQLQYTALRCRQILITNKLILSL